ncbi:tetratricopeptide repeat protein [Actinomyces lilanjuaniae]|uniref:Tetratricopeptide repeat protein n=1 Tax=Actinomyces lilanjuaniae TaxID=2321394 RepID=A0ABM6Z5W6_9ACTO|nr:tetratricopeptide repeat protein [Actinomyces lilanjuaniae]AYD90594.1 tetratricopeptide repeat protein [Actinomyces lilanjuaniae]
MVDDAQSGTDGDGPGQGPQPDSVGRPGRDELRSFLSSAPEGLRGWASEQLARLDAEGADGEPDPPAGSGPGGADGAHGATGDDLDDEPAADVEDLLPDDPTDDLLPEDREADLADTAGTQPRKAASARQSSQVGSSPARPRARPSSTPRRRGGVSRTTLVLVVLLSAALVVLIQQTGRGDTSAEATMTMPADHPSVAGADATEIAQMDEAEPVDAEQEATLQAEAEADPSNITARQELGVMYLRAALYQDAITWLQQILDTDPDNVDALLTIGVAEYQSNQYEEAETHWRHASQVSPDTAEPWYNLGFLYMAQSPPDTEQAAQCWDKVLEVAPDSDMAETVRSHQGHLGSGSSGSPAPSASTSATRG